MHSNGFTTAPTLTDEDDSQSTPAADKRPWPRWAVRARTRLRTTTKSAKNFVDADPSGAASLFGAAVAAVLAIVLVFTALATAVNWLTSGHAPQDVVDTLPVLRIVTDPIGHWLTVHTAGLPVTAAAAAWIWGLAGFALFYSASYRHLGAQLLWPAFGAATAAMAATGTDTATHRPIVAGLVAVVWIALSLVALRGRRRANSKPQR